MRIQHNIPAMSAYRNYTNNTNALKKNLERLSSGYKINRAGDDAAGLAISEKMRAQITGLEVAQKNSKDGISLVQTAEGALTEVHDMLNRMYELAEQSANGTYDNEVDRVQLQKEIASLSTEIDRISKASNFNGIKLLDGSMATSSASALGSLLSNMGVDGSSPTAAGAAEITVQMNNAAASASEVLSSDPTKDVDGSPVVAATEAVITLTVGGNSDADVDTAAKFTGKVGGTDITDAATYDSTAWKSGDSLTVKVGTKEYKFSFDAQDGFVTAASDTALKSELEKIGLTVGTTPNAVDAKVAAAEISGFDATAKITAGTTTLAQLKALAPVSGVKLEDMFDIEVTSADGNTTRTADSDVIQNGDVIKLTAKKAGQMETGGGKVYTVLSSGLTANAPANAASSLAGKVEAENGKDEGFSTVTPAVTEYSLTINIDNLRGGQYLSVGDPATTTNKISFVTKDPAASTTTEINLNTSDGNSNGSNKDEIAAAIKSALDNIFSAGNKFDTGKTTWKDNGDGTFTYTAKGDNNANSATSNLGEVRVFSEGGADITNTVTSPISSTYNPAAVVDPSTPTQSAFAKVTYEIDASDIKAGNKIIVGDKEIEFVATAGDVKDPSKQVAVGSGYETKLVQALEQAGFDAGKVTADVTTTSGKLLLSITGTEVGQTAADLKENEGKVKFFNADDNPPSEVKVGNDAASVITAGKTKVSEILDNSLGTVNGTAKTVGDLFKITDANGKELDANHVFEEGETFKFVAKDKGKIPADILNKLRYSGNANVSVKNGFDEGKSATGDRTHYDITFDMSKLAGGNSFTIGNVNGTSYTYDLSYDTEGTTNGTIGANDKTDVADEAANRRPLNLIGMNQTQVIEKIKQQLQADLGDKFQVGVVVNDNKFTMTLDAVGEGADYNLGNIRYSSQSKGIVGSNYNPAGGSSGGIEGTYAQVSYEFDLSKLELGDTLTLGSGSDAATVYFGEETKTETDPVTGKAKITVSLDDAKEDSSLIVKALESAGYRSGQVRFNADNTMTITGIQTGETAAALAGKGGKVSVGSSTGRELTTGGLTLQIGDTAEDFNKLKVSIKACDSASIGVGDIDVSTQDGASDAMAKIKEAINYVSDVRGDLGAAQNRLDHTINNLSVMQENIQDAESSIRDVDIAEEMMAYTKNNILVQSAQAMLAQANQLPQGVLQLLQ